MTELRYRLPQVRELRTALPGPRSTDLAALRAVAVAAQVRRLGDAG